MAKYKKPNDKSVLRNLSEEVIKLLSKIFILLIFFLGLSLPVLLSRIGVIKNKEFRKNVVEGFLKNYADWLQSVYAQSILPIFASWEALVFKFKSILAFVRSDFVSAIMWSVPVSILIGIVLLKITPKERSRKSEQINEMMRDILSRFEFYYNEQTKITQTDSDGEVLLDQYGRPEHLTIDHYPRVDLSDLPNSILFKDVHPKITQRITDYSHGFLSEMKRLDLIEVNQGEVESTGYPGQLRIKLFEESDLLELALFRSIGWYESKKINNVKKEIFPTVRVSEKEVIVDFKGINITEGIVYSGLEKFQNFHNIKLKSRFHHEGTRYFFRYQAKLSKIFEKGETILSKFVSNAFDKQEETLNLERKLLEENTEFRDKEIDEILLKYYERLAAIKSEDLIGEIKMILDNLFSTGDKIVSNSIVKHFINDIPTDPQAKKRVLILQGDPRVKINGFEEYIIKPMRDYKIKTGAELMFVGEIIDPDISLNYSPIKLRDGQTSYSQIFTPVTSGGHIVNVGQTRSGKSKSVQSFVFTLAYAYGFMEGVKPPSFFFADGKSSLDYDIFAKKLSDYAVAKISNVGEDPLIELANVVNKVFEIYLQRVEQMRELAARGFNASTYIEYNKYCRPEETMERVFLIIDEFKLFIDASPVGVEAAIDDKGTIFNYLNIILRAGSSFGLSLQIASQRIQVTDLPSQLRSNLTVRLAHSVPKNDAAVLGISADDVSQLGVGEFILNIAGYYDSDTKNQNLKCTMPYIGDEPHMLLDKFWEEDREHKGFDYDLIYNQGKEDDLAKIGAETLMKYVKNVFVKREGGLIIDERSATQYYMSLFCEIEIGRKKYKLAIGVTTPEEVFDENFYSKLQNETPKDFHTYQKFFFLIGNTKVNQTNLLDLEDQLLNTYFMMSFDYSKPLKRGIGLYKAKDLTPIFKQIVADKVGSTLVGEKLEVTTVKEKEEDEFNMLTLDEFHRIRALKNVTVKGDLFEKFCHQLEKYFGHDSVTSREIVESGDLGDMYNSTRNESGLDLLRWVNRKERRAIIIQCKNKPSRSLSTEVIDKLVKTAQVYSKGYAIRVEGSILYASGKLTKQTKAEAELCKIAVFDYKKIVAILEDIESRELGILDDDPDNDEILPIEALHDGGPLNNLEGEEDDLEADIELLDIEPFEDIEEE